MLRHLLLVLLSLLTVTTSSGSGLLALDTARAATTVGGSESEVDVLLRVKANHVGRHVDDLLADTDVTLLDQDTSVVNGLGKSELIDTGLQTTLQEVLDTEGQDVIELHAGLIEHTNADQTTNQSVTFEKTLGVLLIEGEKLTSSTTDLGKGELDTPHLTLVAQAVLADNLQFRVKTSGLERTTRDLVGLGVNATVMQNL